MEQNLSTRKIFATTIILALITSYPIIWLYDQFHSSGSFLAELSNNFYISTLYGLIYTLPFYLGLFGKLNLLNFRKLAIFIFIPTFLFDLLWSFGDIGDLTELLLLSLLLSIFGIIIGYVILFLKRKPR